jgi:hypothetical protein
MAKKKSKKLAKVAKKATAKPARAKRAKPRTSRMKSTNAAKGKPHTNYHKDGSTYAKGQLLDGKMHGYWEFFRKDGTIMRSGSFDREQQIGTWTTYDIRGNVYKVMEMNAAAKTKSGASKAGPIKATAKPPARKSAKKPKLLSGGNPQIAKADGHAPVEAYIAAMPGWKSGVGRRLDALVTRTIPGVHKAVKWNSPLYGIEGEGWFLAIHCFTKYIKVAFFRGTSLRPVPSGESKQKEVRYLNIHEDDLLDEGRFAGWVKQASQLPGVRM